MIFSFRKIPKGVIYTLVAILAVGSGIALKRLSFKSGKQRADFPVFQKGMVYADWTKEGYITFASDDSLKELSKAKAEWVALTVTWYQDKYNSFQIRPLHNTPSDSSVLHAIRRIHELGMKVMLKPHVDILETVEGKWRGEIDFNNPQDWQAWFNSYRDFVVHYVEIANTENVELFCLGTELTSSTINHPEEWRKLIVHVRDIYKGYLTYAANWHDEFSKITFWDAFDYAGVDPYFPLVEAKTPSVEELKVAWRPWVKQLDDWQAKIKKPVIFPEIGYKSTDDPGNSPWEHDARGQLNVEAQANAYQALLETFFYKKWFWGAYWWYWQVSINPRLSLTRGFSPRGKPAEGILRKWYSKPDPGIEKAYYLKIAKVGLGKRESFLAPPAELDAIQTASAFASQTPVALSNTTAIITPEHVETAPIPSTTPSATTDTTTIAAVEPVKTASVISATHSPITNSTATTTVTPVEPLEIASASTSQMPVALSNTTAIKTIEPIEIASAAASPTPAALSKTTDIAKVEPIKTTVTFPSSFVPVWQRGMCYITWNKDSFKNTSSDHSLNLLKSLGADWVSLSPSWYQDKYNSSAMQANNKTPTDEGMIHVINKIHELGMKVMLKPHLDLLDQNEGHWRGEIEFASDQEWDSWFKNYTEFILHYAKMAKEQGVEMFCVGTELTRSAISQPNRWRQLIKEVRDVYPGILTYAANWYDEYFRIGFWDLLDYAGVDPYFPLIEKERPSLKELRDSWKLWARLVEEWQAKIKKPVIFPEIGYKSSTESADQPWLTLPGKEVDLGLQKDCYLALMETFWNKPWFYGQYWWYWGTHPKMGGEFNRGYTPQNKPAEKLVREWYHKPKPPALK